jgi:hypothetical protein
MAEEKHHNTEESAADRSLGELLRELNRVEAPNDFDFKVKARIANADPREFKKRRLVPVYVYPLVIVVIAGSAFLVSEFLPGQSPTVPEVVADSNKTVPQQANSGIQPGMEMPKQPEIATGNPPKAISPLANPGKSDADQTQPGGSITSGLGTSQPVLPRGFNVNAVRKNVPIQPKDSNITVIDLMSFLGVESRFEGQSLKISSVKNGSVADKSGIKAGDIVEALENTPITPTIKLAARFEAKTLTINREGQHMQIKIGGH